MISPQINIQAAVITNSTTLLNIHFPPLQRKKKVTLSEHLKRGLNSKIRSSLINTSYRTTAPTIGSIHRYKEKRPMKLSGKLVARHLLSGMSSPRYTALSQLTIFMRSKALVVTAHLILRMPHIRPNSLNTYQQKV